MRIVNVILAILISLACGLLALEGGLRLLGRGPQETINRFDPITGWSKIPGASSRRSTSEFDVRYEINALGLRESHTLSYAKPAGTYRVLCLGDSFTLGYTVDERDLFVDQLRRSWLSEGRAVDVINAGTEGWSTDQEVAWYLSEGVKYQPDLVLIFPYENDLYWNGQSKYRRFPKPRFGADGTLDPAPLVDPGPAPWSERSAIGMLFKGTPKDPSGVLEVPFEDTKFSLSAGKKDEAPVVKKPGFLPREWAAMMVTPPDFMLEAIARTRGALTHLRDQCAKTGTQLVMVPIPSKAAVQHGAGESLKAVVCLRETRWHPDQAVRTFMTAANDLRIKAFDPTADLRAVARTPQRELGTTGEPELPEPELYFARDWHFNPRGNLEFARFIHDRLDVAQIGLPPATGALASFTPGPPPPRSKTWMLLFGGLWVGLTALYYGNYRDEPKWQPPLKVFGMLAVIFTLFMGIKAAMGLVPPAIAPKLVILFVCGVLGFVLYTLGRRIGTIAELTKAFVLRGHWYLMPLLVVLLSIGSLLVVAASSPIAAPFIYTLF